MIKNYLTYIKENNDELNIDLKNFIPIDIFKYYNKEVELYINHMRSILKIGKYIIFNGSDSYNDYQFKGYIKKVITDERGRIHVILDDEEEYVLYPSETVRVFDKKPEKIEKPELDPYGEEDWGYNEIDENIHSDIDPYGEEDWNDTSLDEIKKILNEALHYFNGKIIYYSKSGYRKIHPEHLVVFNSIIYIGDEQAFTHCDIDVTKDFETIKKISEIFNNVEISVYGEGFYDERGGFFWSTERGVWNDKHYDNETLLRND